MLRSSLEVLGKKGVIKYFTKFSEKRLCWSIFLNKVADLRPTTLLKKRLQHKYFPVNFVKFLRIPFNRTPSVAASDCYQLWIFLLFGKWVNCMQPRIIKSPVFLVASSLNVQSSKGIKPIKIYSWVKQSLREKYPTTEFFLVRIFLYSVQIQENRDHKKHRIWTLFKHWVGLENQFD